MKLSELLDRYQESTTSASAVLRGLALAGLGFVWLFAAPTLLTNNGSLSDVNRTLVVAGVVFAVALALDALQLVVKAALLAYAYQREEAKAWPDDDAKVANPDPDVTSLGRSPRIATEILWWGKVGFAGAGWIVVAVFLARS